MRETVNQIPGWVQPLARLSCPADAASSADVADVAEVWLPYLKMFFVAFSRQFLQSHFYDHS